MLTLDTIKAHNEAVGQHFFATNAMRFFRSRIHAEVIETPTGGWFVTSERYVSSRGSFPRKYTVCFYRLDNGHIEAGSEFQAFATASAAHEWMRQASVRPEPTSEWAACADAGHPGIEHGIRCSRCCRCLQCAEQRRLEMNPD